MQVLQVPCYNEQWTRKLRDYLNSVSVNILTEVYMYNIQYLNYVPTNRNSPIPLGRLSLEMEVGIICGRSTLPNPSNTDEDRVRGDGEPGGGHTTLCLVPARLRRVVPTGDEGGVR